MEKGQVQAAGRQVARRNGRSCRSKWSSSCAFFHTCWRPVCDGSPGSGMVYGKLAIKGIFYTRGRNNEPIS